MLFYKLSDRVNVNTFLYLSLSSMYKGLRKLLQHNNIR